MEVVYSRNAVKFIAKQNSKTKQRIKAAIECIPSGDIRPLKGVRGTFRLRVGSIRALFSYPFDNVVLVEKIGFRGDIY